MRRENYLASPSTPVTRWVEVLLLRGSTRCTPVFRSHEVKVSGCLQPEASTVRMEAVVLRIVALKVVLRYINC